MNHRPGATLAAGSQPCCRLSDFRPPQLSYLPPPLTLPPVMVLFAGNRYWLSSIGLLIAGAALAFQPDRAVAGALTAGLAVQWVYRRDAWVTLSLIGASCGFAATLVRDDH